MAIEETAKNKLKHAYELIKAKDLGTARILIEGVLQTHPENIDARWLLVYTLSAPREKRRALQKVLDLKPDHTAAQEMLDRLNHDFPPHQEKPQYTWRDTQVVAATHKRPRRRIRWTLVILSLLSWAGAMFTFFASYDALTGANNLSFLRSSKNYGYVEDEDNRRSIPIMKDEPAQAGAMITDTLPRGEAHRYRFWGNQGQQLIILVVFTTEFTQNNSEGSIAEALASAGQNFNMDEGFDGGNVQRAVNVAEILDRNGHLVAREDVFNLQGAHYLQFTPPADGTYYLLLASREGGSAGHYVLQVDTVEGLTSDADALLQSR